MMSPQRDTRPTNRLEDFDRPVVLSATSDREYFPEELPEGGFSCQCEFNRYHPEQPCRHALTVINRRLAAKVGYLEEAHQWSEAAIGTFEQVLQRFEHFRTFEMRYLAVLMLSIALGNEKGEVSCDDLYDAIGGKTKGDPRIIGAVVGGLKKRGFLVPLHYMGSRRNHARPVLMCRISDEGRRALEEQT